MSDQSLIINNVSTQFQEKFNRSPSVIVAAPGRVNLIGGHIDYNDGLVLPMALDRTVVIAADIKEGKKSSNLYSCRFESMAEIPLECTRTPHKSEWYTYVEGVLAQCKAQGIDIPAFDALIYSDIPVGGGLSSSAALEVATATLVEAITGNRFEQAQKALLCQKAEYRYAGVPCGIMDQFSSVFAKVNTLMLLDCKSQELKHIPFFGESLVVLITNTNVSHNLGDGEYKKRRVQCDGALKKIGTSSWREVTLKDLEISRSLLSSIEYNRAHHVVTEIERTIQASEAFINQDWLRAGSLITDSHNSLRDHYDVSCVELNALVDILNELGVDQGVYGARMTGGGFGGCTVSLVKADSVAAVQKTLHQRYAKKAGIQASSFISRPAQGAQVLQNRLLTK
jgi:galactokinase